jgi:acyl-CoA synthetase (AMP-forming)/AMP-acid ligase II
MDISLIVTMAAEAAPERIAFGPKASGVTYEQLLEHAMRLAAKLRKQHILHVTFLGVNSRAVPITLFGAALAGRPFVPLNYRLADPQLQALAARCAPSAIVVDTGFRHRIVGIDGIIPTDWQNDGVSSVLAEERDGSIDRPDDVAVLLFTSGTTGEPKAAVLRHRHLAEYIINTVEFMSADESDCALISVPPYHVAGVSAVLSSVYAGRRFVQLESFDANGWVSIARDEAVTHAMVVPTMLGRILDVLAKTKDKLPALRSLSYGGGRTPLAVVERALKMLPHVNFVNAYGLTETSSTIALLTPEDHVQAISSMDPAICARLGSVGRPLDSIELEIRDEFNRPLANGQRGEIHVRGGQISGEYVGRSTMQNDGWFATRDGGYLDSAGYLFIDGRLDDVIIRGGENMSPGEIEQALMEHPFVADAAVFGVPDADWGEKIVAVVVLHGTVTSGAEDEVSSEELQEWVRTRLRSSRSPSLIAFRDSLPYNESGKLLRRVLRAEFASQ